MILKYLGYQDGSAMRKEKEARAVEKKTITGKFYKRKNGFRSCQKTIRREYEKRKRSKRN